MPVARVKGGQAPKVCDHCGREFEWRAKWRRDWEAVRYCSERCRRQAKSDRSERA
jgi:hypothetical protein